MSMKLLVFLIRIFSSGRTLHTIYALCDRICKFSCEDIYTDSFGLKKRIYKIKIKYIKNNNLIYWPIVFDVALHGVVENRMNLLVWPSEHSWATAYAYAPAFKNTENYYPWSMLQDHLYRIYFFHPSHASKTIKVY